ncbi:uncharacterized protein GGS22DRAFT_125645 [Annulohypoxylon maeteangense]|uniref:uncharacterized protein n=1 Tax=Annulohypoxylon maeteangense TaxID=1927788 RepID=UPI002008AED7|nr:uncharacterized protein GGS22DRAFT_125645 [Annulohypoxylon maeteangense]KAI0886189.1 hypothetical protein GGS22DRAFT_125645 [Annulohypoxylon maeteangense]
MKSRKRTADNEGGNAYKRHRNPQYSGGTKTNSTMDPNYGQRSAFGDFECLTTVPTGDSDLDWEDDSDALSYLKSVRTQASAIPHVLAASKAGPQLPPQFAAQSTNGSLQGGAENIDRSIYKDGTGDFRGYYHDGAYTAYPSGYFDKEEDTDEEQDGDYDEANQDYEEGEEGENLELNYDEDSSLESDSEGRPHNSNVDEIRDAYFASLTNQYLALRQILQTDPPHDVLLSLPKSNPTEVREFGSRSDTFPKWAGRIRGTDPLPAQVAGMRKEGVIRLLRIILGGKFLRKKQTLWERTSRWIWALLARLPERGELDYQEIGYIRELGKRAVLLMVSLVEMEVLKEHYDVGDSSAESLGEPEIDDEGIDEELSPEGFDEFDDVEEEATATNAKNAQPKIVTEAGASVPKEVAEELSDVEMQIDSDSEAEDGEVSEVPQNQAEELSADIETAKARLLRQLGATDEEEDAEAVIPEPETTDLMDEAFAALAADEEVQKKEERQRAKINERATLNMILTVAGEFYGQRDLLEFRDPFGGL